MKASKIFKSAFSVWSILGIFLGCISIFHLVTLLFSMGIPDVFKRILSAYTYVFHDVIFDSIFAFLNFDVSAYWKDIFVIWGSFAGILTRTIVALQRNVVDLFEAGENVVQTRGGDNWLLSFTTFLMNRIWPYKYYTTRRSFHYSVYIFVISMIVWPFFAITFIFYDMYIGTYKGRGGEDITRGAGYKTILLAQTLAVMLGVALILLTNAALTPSK